MGGRLRQDELQPGDVLLMQGTSLISDLIQVFDPGKYTHAALYDGEQVAEMLPQGTTARSLAESVAGTHFVDVYRFIGSDGTPFAQLGREPVLERVKFYVGEGNRYGYEQIVLLALLCATRSEAHAHLSPVQAMILRSILDSAAEEIAKLIHAGRTPMICSEFVYRCYTEAGSRYAIRVLGSDVPEPAFAAGAGEAALAGVALQQEAAKFLLNYAVAKGHDVGTREFASAAVPAAIVAASAVADFVTPHDLKTSPNLQLIGALHLG